MCASPVIAIIDDEEHVREAVARLVESLGYGAEVYTSAEEFLVQVEASAASCLLVDVHLKDLSGIELGRELSSLGFTLPIIIMTGSNDPMLRKQAMELDCAAFLQKPFRQELLAEALVAAIGRPGKAIN